MKRTSGTKEWAESNINCYYGCSNNCTYCYAKRMSLRFNRISSDEEWEDMKPNQKAIDKKYRKRKGVIMFPTSHDITPESVDNYCIVLKKLLKVGNTVLITTKANYDCIDKIYEKVLSKKDKTLNQYKNQVEFRITITSINDKTSKKYEPNAPPVFFSRLTTLALLTALGFKTSVSIEPFLDKNPVFLIELLSEHTNGTIWLGSLSGQIPLELKQNYTKQNLNKIIKRIEKLPKKIREKIRLKDSIVNKLNLSDNKI